MKCQHLILVIKPVDWSQFGNVEPHFVVRSHEANKSQAIRMNGVATSDGYNIPMHTLDRVGVAFQCGADYIINFNHKYNYAEIAGNGELFLLN